MTRDYAEAIRREGGLIDHQALKRLLSGMFPHDFLETAMTQEASLTRLALGLMSLSVHKSSKGEHFVIGDSPVLVLRAVFGGTRNLLHPGSQVIMPISSKYVLAYRWAAQDKVIQYDPDLDREQVRSLGKDYYYQTDSRYMYGRTEDSLRHAQAAQTQKPSMPHLTEVSDGWAVMHVIQEEISKLQAEQDKQEQQQRDAIARFLVQNAASGGIGKD